MMNRMFKVEDIDEILILLGTQVVVTNRLVRQNEALQFQNAAQRNEINKLQSELRLYTEDNLKSNEN